MKVGLVILNYNDYNSTIKLIKDICNFSEIDHIVVVDNCSTNESYQKLQEIHDSRWDLIQTKINKGYANGNNIGAKFLIDNYLVDIIGIVNPDVSFDDFFIKKIKENFEKNDEYALITGVELNKDGNIDPGAFWRKRAWLHVCQRDLMSTIKGIWQEISQRMACSSQGYVVQSLLRHDSLFPVDVVVGSLFFIRANDFIKVEGFDEGTFLFMEEDILAWRISQFHKYIGIDPTIQFTHLGSTSVSSVMSQLHRKKLQFKSEKYFLDKYIHPNWFWKQVFNIKKAAGLGKLYVKCFVHHIKC